MATVTQKHRPEAKRSPYKLDVPKEVNFLDCFYLQSEIHRNLIVLFVFYLPLNLTEERFLDICMPGLVSRSLESIVCLSGL